MSVAVHLVNRRGDAAGVDLPTLVGSIAFGKNKDTAKLLEVPNHFQRSREQCRLKKNVLEYLAQPDIAVLGVVILAVLFNDVREVYQFLAGAELIVVAPKPASLLFAQYRHQSLADRAFNFIVVQQGVVNVDEKNAAVRSVWPVRPVWSRLPSWRVWLVWPKLPVWLALVVLIICHSARISGLSGTIK